MQKILLQSLLDGPLPFCLINDSGGAYQRHLFEIIVESPYVFIHDNYFCPRSRLTSSRELHSHSMYKDVGPSPTGTHPEAIRVLMVMPPMPELSNASDWALKWRTLRFVFGRLILHTESKYNAS